ncbi:MAG: GAF domain-containing protein [Desulfobacter sp.]|nr:MAG: GAF domain-containing protein [Desulfobacter sp.]
MNTQMAMDENKSGNRAQQRSLEKTLAVLFEISNAVSHTRNLEEFYGVIHKALDTILCVDNFFIALYDPVKDLLKFPYYVNETSSPPLEISNFSKTQTLIGQVIQTRTPMIFDGKESLETACGHNNGRPFKVWLGSPLIVKNRVIGVMSIQDYASATAFHSGDLSLLNSVSQHVALAIERKEAETQIKDQGQILEKILESSPVGIALIEDRLFKWVNTEMVRMFGYRSKQEFENQNVKMVYGASQDFILAGKTIYQGIAPTEKVDYEINMIKQDGSLFPVHVRLNSTRIHSPLSWTIGTFIDISQRRAAEKETFERERLQGVLEMAGAVCHEINQPLQAILGYSELLLMDPCSPSSKKSLSSIKSQASRLGSITTTLANITQYKTVDYPGNTKIVDIWGAAPKTGAKS